MEEQYHTIPHRGADELAKTIEARLADTDYRYALGMSGGLMPQYYCVIAKKDVTPPTPEEVMEGKYLSEYFKILSGDFETFKIGIHETLKVLGY